MDRKLELSTLWVFVVLNFVYADVVALFDIVYNAKGNQSGIDFTPAALLGVSVLVEIPMAMVILSRVLPVRAGRWANLIAGVGYTAVTLVTQFIIPIANGATAIYYIFFGAIEIVATSLVVWLAWTWPRAQGSSRVG